jgi:hypothetical protein
VGIADLVLWVGWPVLVVMWMGDQRQSRVLVSLAAVPSGCSPVEQAQKKPAFPLAFPSISVGYVL